MAEGKDRKAWIHTSHFMWAAFIAAGADGDKIAPETFYPFDQELLKEQPIEISSSDWAAIGAAMVKAGMPLVEG